MRKRLQIANELLVTEKHYVDILELLVKVQSPPLTCTVLVVFLTPIHVLHRRFVRYSSSPCAKAISCRRRASSPSSATPRRFGTLLSGLWVMMTRHVGLGTVAHTGGRDKHVLFHELLHKRVRDWMTFQQFGVGDIFYDHVRCVKAPSPPPGGSTRRS